MTSNVEQLFPLCLIGFKESEEREWTDKHFIHHNLLTFILRYMEVIIKSGNSFMTDFTMYPW